MTRPRQEGGPIRVGLFAASPVYYQAPLYRRLAADHRIDFTAIFASDQGARRPFDNGYEKPVEWGVDALGGYRSIFVKKAGTNPTGGRVSNLRDPDIIGRVWLGQYDVLWLHGYHTVTHVLAAMTQKVRRGGLLYREDQTLLNRRPRWKTAVKQVGLRTLFHGSHGLFVGVENRRWFERWGIRPERLFHVPYAVDNGVFQEAAKKLAGRRAEIRSEFGIENGGPVFLTVGRLIEKKQPLYLLEAFRRVRRKRRCSLLIMGTGPLEPEMRERVREQAIPDVVFAGFLDQTQVAHAYVAADVFALVSSHDETWGLVVNEAMNFGLPVVVSDKVGCAADLIRDGENGFVVPFDNEQALVERLGMLADSRDLRHRLGAVSRERICAWNYSVAADGLLRAIEHAVGPERWAAADEWRRRTDVEFAAEASR